MNRCTVLHPCPVCDEPDPHCEHRVNLAVAVCAECTPIQPATCSRMLFSAVVSGDYRTFYACALHRFDLSRGVGVKGYWPDEQHPLREFLPLGPGIVDMPIPCSYCVAARKDLDETRCD